MIAASSRDSHCGIKRPGHGVFECARSGVQTFRPRGANAGGMTARVKRDELSAASYEGQAVSE